MYQGIPVIGISGGIGGGKSFVARVLGELGCFVIDSDRQVSLAYELPEVLETLRQWWGDEVVLPTGKVNRHAIAKRVFGDPGERKRLENLLHPKVAHLRDVEMERAAAVTPRPVAFVWDTPLLFETGLWKECDALIFVETPREERLRRVTQSRGWDDAELRRRENSQWPLDNKRNLSHYVIENSARAAIPRETYQAGKPHPNPDETLTDQPTPGESPADLLRNQIRLVLTRILEADSGLGRI